MAKIAVKLERALALRAARGGPGSLTTQVLASGNGWTVQDVICTSGPQDRPFEERHAGAAIAIVAAGSFQYRASRGRELMTPGSLVLGNPGQSFECEHQHGQGDRCISFWYSRGYFERLCTDAGAGEAGRPFRVLRIPPLRALAAVAARACTGLVGAMDVAWEELSVKLAAQVVQLSDGQPAGATPAQPGAIARVTRVVRMIESDPEVDLSLDSLAQQAGLSPYHFLRTFERLTGLTPHQYILRARLRNAATRLATEPARVIDVALDSGFGDVSNFNRAFRAEFGVSPRAYRRQTPWRLAGPPD